MTMRKSTLMALIGAGLAAAALAAPAVVSAASAAVTRQDARTIINQAKTAGIVGEMADGYLGVRVEAQMTAQIRAAMAEINGGRAELYRQAAVAAGAGDIATGTAAAGASSFQQRFGSIPAGQWYRDSGGVWRQK
ncbi:DUF1318 domain-containing protein [Brevundimonas sp.]|uniref:DUF1318 domain-containing protein n=1 Tax=Brevundimonas sp. TaxID=1871086 RepID=UPI0025F5B551|nr:DUF1318 domain-containing protein [Brevundimonas sp.]